MGKSRLASMSWVLILVFLSLSRSVLAQQILPLSPELRVTEAAQIQIDDLLFSVSWNPVNRELAISGDGGVYVYDAQFSLLETLKLEENPATISTIWSPDGQTAASLHASGNVYFWDANTRSILDTWHAGIHLPTSIAWSPDGTKIARSSIDGTIKIYDVVERQEIYTSHQIQYGSIPKSLAWNADSRRLLFIGQNDTMYGVFIFDTVTNNLVDAIVSEASTARWSPDGDLLAIGDFSPRVNTYGIGTPGFGIITIWEDHPDLQFKSVMLTYDATDALAWHPNGEYLASYNWDQQIQIWDVAHGQLVAEIPGGGRPNPSDTYTFDSLAWSPDGSQLADAGVNGTVYIWNVSEP